MTSSLIELRQLCRIFEVGDEQVHALRDVNLDIGVGEYLSLMGPSGSGKSTLLNIVGLLDNPSSGIYRLNGRDTASMDQAQLARYRGETIGFVFQFFQLIPRLTAFENVELPLMLAGEATAARREKVSQALADAGLVDRMQHRPSQLSGGQRQRVAIARATVTRPRLLLADEPTGNLDSASGRGVIGVLESLNKNGMTVIVVTHDPDIGGRATRRLQMVDGRIDSDRRATS